MSQKRLALIPGHCLFPDHSTLSPDKDTIIFMAEDFGLCTHYKYHKHKLVLFLSAMRSHAEEIEKDFKLVYHELNAKNKNSSYEDKLLKTINKEKVNSIVTYDLEDHFFDRRIRAFCKENKLDLEVIDSPAFITSKSQFEEYLGNVKKPFMHTFYQRQRKDLNLLVNDQGAPFGGKWSFDDENRKPLPKGIELPERVTFSKTDHTENVKELVNELFADHPGSTDNFNWATTRRQALSALDKFLKQRFEKFGPYEDAIKSDEAFLFHSTLSPYLNLGLITASEVLEKAIEFYENEDTHFPSVEGFVRQIAGWREFIRGIYHNYDLNKNFLNHNRKLKSCWYDAKTGIEPLDDSIAKAMQHGYTHHIERLMILGNIMLLCQIHPDEVYKWFMEMFVDSSDWVMAPNVYGMSQFAEGGIFATKPYVGGANYISKMSNYKKKSPWSETVDGLYWLFIENHREMISKNHRMKMMLGTLDRMKPERKLFLFEKANAFINRVTTS